MKIGLARAYVKPPPTSSSDLLQNPNKSFKQPIKAPMESLDPVPHPHLKWAPKRDFTPKKIEPKKVLLEKDLTVIELAQVLKVDLSKVLASFAQFEDIENPPIESLVSTDVAEMIVKEFGQVPIISSKEIKVDRSPIVTIMGHVDHGKTTLLDGLRNSSICATEYGGITQSIGAFKVKTSSGEITFIDTPGHLAFKNMRERGAEITDIIVLVVCASEGVRPQTLECIDHALSYEVPIIVALNKIDLSSAEISRVEMELLKAGLVLDKFGGEVLHVPISAKKKINLDKLEETILFQAELMQLQEAADVRARGFVIESKILEGRGPLCSVIVKRGTLKVGDPIVAGPAYGVVKRLLNENMTELKEVGLSSAAEVIGLKGLPNMGDPFIVTHSLKLAEKIASRNEKKLSEVKLSENRTPDEKFVIPKMSYVERKKLMNRDTSMLVERLKEEVSKVESGEISAGESSALRQMQKRNEKSIHEQIEMIESMFNEKDDGAHVKIILKAKNSGMLEAMEKSIKELSKQKAVRAFIISSQVGTITNDDLTISEMFQAAILCMNVKLEKPVMNAAEKKKIPIKSHKIIYHLLQDVENLMRDQLEKSVDIVSGKAEVKDIYEVTVNKSKEYLGKVKVAGLTVVEGNLVKRLLFKVIRNGSEIANGIKASSLKVLKENAKEVKKGGDCGIILEDYDELQKGDIVVSYEVKEVPKKFKNERKEVSFEDVKDK